MSKLVWVRRVWITITNSNAVPHIEADRLKKLYNLPNCIIIRTMLVPSVSTKTVLGVYSVLYSQRSELVIKENKNLESLKNKQSIISYARKSWNFGSTFAFIYEFIRIVTGKEKMKTEKVLYSSIFFPQLHVPTFQTCK